MSHSLQPVAASQPQIRTRPFKPTDSEHRSAILVWNAAWPDRPITIEDDVQNVTHRTGKALFQRLVTEVDGVFAAFGEFFQPNGDRQPEKFAFDFHIHPDYAGQGLEQHIYDYIRVRLAEHHPGKLATRTRDDKQDRVRFLADQGFHIVLREPLSELSLDTFDPTGFADIEAGLRRQGIEILPVAEVRQRDPNWKRKLWDLEWEIEQDIPTRSGQLRQRPFEEFEQWVTNPHRFQADSFFVAVHREQYVGLTGLHTSQAAPLRMHTPLTGVVRRYRRRGIATALKLRAIALAQQRGVRVIDTSNEENNPMIKVNVRLGFKTRFARLIFEKELAQNQRPILQ